MRPGWAPALPPEARALREPNDDSGTRSLLCLVIVALAVSIAVGHYYRPEAPTDERLVSSIFSGVAVAFVAAAINRVLKIGLLSRLAERIVFVLVPPLALIFLVLGTIFIGIATPTEGGAMGASGALVLALLNNRLDWKLLRQAMDTTAKLSSFVVFILVGSTVFSLVFRGVDGDLWVEHLLLGLPGGQIGFLIVTNLLCFVLAFFLDFFELAFIVVPLLGPVAQKLGIDLIWFGVLLGVNMQTSFMHPPFGFALFYLRGVAPKEDFLDRVTGKLTKRVTTGQIYWGAVPFVCIQVIMVALVIAFPNLVLSGVDRGTGVDPNKVQIEIPQTNYGDEAPIEIK
jgi:tripartite ATP-independent transporter DctM subunit